MATLKLKSWGQEYKITLRTDTYVKPRNLYIGMDYYDEECGCYLPYGDITVNLEGCKCKENCGYVDTNNNPGIEAWITANKIGKPTGRIRPSGFCVYPEYEFDLNEIAKYKEEVQC